MTGWMEGQGCSSSGRLGDAVKLSSESWKTGMLGNDAFEGNVGDACGQLGRWGEMGWRCRLGSWGNCDTQ